MLQEKSIQNTSLAAGLCSERMLTFLSCIFWLSSPLEWKQTLDHKEWRAKKKKKKETQKIPTFSDVFGSWLVATFELISQSAVHGHAPNL